MPLIQRLQEMNTTKPKTKYSTNAMQGKIGRGSVWRTTWAALKEMHSIKRKGTHTS